MNYRYMRLLLFFDLPVEKKAQRRNYSRFVKDIKSLGFYMFQKSVYLKLCLDQRIANSTIEKVKKISPKEGSVAVLTITEKQFGDISIILGEINTEVINSDERNIEL